MTRKPTAPYAPGDKVNILRTEAGHGTVWGPLTLTRVVPLNDGRTWRLETTRHDGTALHVVVGTDGRDVNDYVAPVQTGARP